MAEALLDVDGLCVDYRVRGARQPRRVLHGVDLRIGAGECVGVVGESGSGKSTLGRAVLGLAPVAEGSIRFAGTELTSASRGERRALAKDLQVVFQDPYGSLDPFMTIGQILAEPLIGTDVKAKEARSRVRTLLDRVQLPASAIDRRPHEFSGGQRQRVAIARALVREPRLIICDEPVSALDLHTQTSILDLFLEVQRETGVAYLFVSHDLAVVRRMCHRVAVMRQGSIVEEGDGELVTRAPSHPYTQALLLASPVADPAAQRARRAARHARRDAANDESDRPEQKEEHSDAAHR